MCLWRNRQYVWRNYYIDIFEEEPIAIGIQAGEIKIVGGKIQNYECGIWLEVQTNVSATIGNVTFENNDHDIDISSGKKFTIQDDFKGTASVKVPSFPCTITTPGTSPEMCKRITYD